MDSNISEALVKLAESLESLAESIEKDAEKAAEDFTKQASTSRDLSFGQVSDTPENGDPLLNFLLS